jgi:hypothetical protein
MHLIAFLLLVHEHALACHSADGILVQLGPDG